jgi:hypothetical protein
MNTSPWTRNSADEMTDAECDLADTILDALTARDLRRNAAGKTAAPWVTPSAIARLAHEDLSRVRPVLDWLAKHKMSIVDDGASYGIRHFRLK